MTLTYSNKKFRECMEDNPAEMNRNKLRACISTLMYDEDFQRDVGANDRERLSLICREDKSGHFDFIREGPGSTWYESVGNWFNPETKQVLREKNVHVDVLFKDTPDEVVGLRTVELFGALNKLLLDESLLLTYTSNVEESSL